VDQQNEKHRAAFGFAGHGKINMLNNFLVTLTTKQPPKRVNYLMTRATMANTNA